MGRLHESQINESNNSSETKRIVGNNLVAFSWATAGLVVAGPLGALIGGGLAKLVNHYDNKQAEQDRINRLQNGPK